MRQAIKPELGAKKMEYRQNVLYTRSIMTHWYVRIIAVLGFASVFTLLLLITPAPERATVDVEPLPTADGGDVGYPDISFLAPPPPLPENPPTPKEIRHDGVIAQNDTEPPKATETPPKQAEPEPAPSPTDLVSQPTKETEAKIPFGEINATTREALVNVYCSTKAGGIIQPFSGSGTIIDPRGVVLTNAHIGQYFLIKDYPIEASITCTLRTGSPARETYTTELMYLPAKWIDAHADDITVADPVGTGEHDYALLWITGRVDGSPLPAAFPYVPFSASDVVEQDAPVLVAGYPAELVGTIATLRDLYITSTISSIKKIFTFESITADLVSVGGSVVAQKGASGGAVVDAHSKLIGVVVTATDGASTDERDLRAATMAHISRSMQTHTGKTLMEFLTGDPVVLGSIFNTNEAPILAQKLIDAIEEEYEVAH